MRVFFIYFITIGILLSTIVAFPVRRRNKKVFKTPASFRRVPPDGGHVYECKQANCGKRFTDPILSNLKAHEATHTLPFKCGKDGCDRSFATKSSLATHENSIMAHKADPEAVAKAKRKEIYDPVHGTRKVSPGRE